MVALRTPLLDSTCVIGDPCIHHWNIDMPDGKLFSNGECRYCHEVRSFRNSDRDLGTISKNDLVKDYSRSLDIFHAMADQKRYK